MKLLRFLLPAAAALALTSACLSDKAPGPIEVCTDTSAVTYNGQMAALLETRCNTTGCHNANDYQNAGRINLSNYDDASFETLNGRVICSINRTGDCKAMPDKASKLSACELSAFQRWYDAGCPQE